MSEGHTKERLKELQALPLERKIGFTAARIAEWYSRYDGKVYVSFSGGKDSTVLLHIARTLFPDIKAVYVDTGLEYPETKEFVKTFDNVDILRPKKSFLQVINEYGYPVVSKAVAKTIHEARSKQDGFAAIRLGIYDPPPDCKLKAKPEPNLFDHRRYKYLYNAPFKISHKCCHILKKAPVKSYENKTGLKPIVATTTEESVLRKAEWLKSGCNSFDGKRPISKPMSFWTEQDILMYIKLNNLPIASVYGQIIEDGGGKLMCSGCDRTGCLFCMFGAHLEKSPNRFQRLKQTHPQLWNYCMDKMGLREVCSFMGIDVE